MPVAVFTVGFISAISLLSNGTFSVVPALQHE